MTQKHDLPDRERQHLIGSLKYDDEPLLSLTPVAAEWAPIVEESGEAMMRF